MISIILATFNEADNIKLIVPKISNLFKDKDIEVEIVVVDDNSPDGTADVAYALSQKYPVRVYVRKNERGLATAVMKGFELARGEICLVMDADLSHPVDKIPEMINRIVQGNCDATVGSRYINGGDCENWSFSRKIVSKGARILALGLTHLSDPTSGFMAIKRSVLEGIKLDPIGWKIVLEVIVKTDLRFQEIPIVFADRQFGKSKLDFRVQKEYLLHLWKLYLYKYPNIFQFGKFCFVGLSGLLVDTGVLVALVEFLSFDPRFAAIFAFLIAVSWNYRLNRERTFNIVENIKIIYSYFSFIIICTVGFSVRIGVMHFMIEYFGMRRRPWYVFASILGILAGTIFNFLGSKYIVFSKNFWLKKVCLFRNFTGWGG